MLNRPKPEKYRNLIFLIVKNPLPLQSHPSERFSLLSLPNTRKAAATGRSLRPTKEGICLGNACCRAAAFCRAAFVSVHLRMSMKGAHSQGSNDQLAASGLGVCGSGLYFRLVGAGLPRPLSGGPRPSCLCLPCWPLFRGRPLPLLPSRHPAPFGNHLSATCSSGSGVCASGLAGLSASEGVFA